MEIDIEAPNLSFLEDNNVAAASNIPVKVIRAARLKLGLIKAIPKPEQMQNWKSLGYMSVESNEGSGNCVISVIENWQIELRKNPHSHPPKVTVLGLRRPSNV